MSCIATPVIDTGLSFAISVVPVMNFECQHGTLTLISLDGKEHGVSFVCLVSEPIGIHDIAIGAKFLFRLLHFLGRGVGKRSFSHAAPAVGAERPADEC